MTLTESLRATTSDRGVALLSREADRAVVWLRGEHDIATVVELSDVMARAIALDESGVVVDLSGVQFMGAATVGVIMRAREFLQRQERSFEVRDPSRSAKRILDLCGLGGLSQPERPADGLGTGETGNTVGRWVAASASARAHRRHGATSSLQSWMATSAARAGRVTVPRRRSSPDGQPLGDGCSERVVARDGP